MYTEESTASFGYWIRRQRQALDLTQAELARQVGCATVTVSKLERDERRPSRQMAELLAEKLAVPGEQRARFLAAALGERTVDALPVTSQPVDPPVSAPSSAGHRMWWRSCFTRTRQSVNRQFTIESTARRSNSPQRYRGRGARLRSSGENLRETPRRLRLGTPASPRWV